MNIKKITISLIFVLAVAGFIIYEKVYNNPITATVATTNSNTATSGPIENNLNPDTGNTNPPSQTTPTPTGKYTNGSYTGSVADAFYGQVQVQVTVAGGKITDIQLLKYPDHQGHSLEVSNSSLPQLTSEAIQAQSSNINIISGATQTSQAFMQSLSSALAKAGAQNQPQIQVTPPKMGA
jgi:uncharacterized protein with FMN-binding domain